MPRLVLGRRPGQKVRLVVPPSAVPTVIEVLYANNRQARWGAGHIGLMFDAPAEVKIDRPDAAPKKEPRP